MLASITGAVASRQVTLNTTAMASAGTSTTMSCPIMARVGTPALPRAMSPRHNPISALPLSCASVRAKGGSGTRRSLSASGGIRCGFHLASTMMYPM